MLAGGSSRQIDSLQSGRPQSPGLEAHIADGPRSRRASPPTQLSSVEHQDQLRGPPSRCPDLVSCILLFYAPQPQGATILAQVVALACRTPRRQGDTRHESPSLSLDGPRAPCLMFKGRSRYGPRVPIRREQRRGAALGPRCKRRDTPGRARCQSEARVCRGKRASVCGMEAHSRRESESRRSA